MKPKAQFLLVLPLLLIFTITTFAQGKGKGGRPGGEESTTNLSYPAYFFGTSLQTGTIGTYTLGATFGNGMSYGCLIPETIGTTTYPNTSCVSEDGTTYQDFATCQARCPDVTVERIYWQKNTSSKWQAGYLASGTTLLPVDYIDWGDNLEGKTWPVQVLRVETNTFSTLPALVEGTELASNPRLRFDLWHVFGQGTTELWGVHTTNADPAVPYVYLDVATVPNWPFAVNVTPGARLNIAKLHSGTATCPDTATGITQSPYKGETNLTWSFNDTSKTGRWVGAAYSSDLLYGSELNIKGSYVFGYNWNLRSEPVPGEVGKSGWWRLTFYTPDSSIDFTNWAEPTIDVNTLAPPVDPNVTPGPIVISEDPVTPAVERRLRLQDRTRLTKRAQVEITAEEGESGLMLYVPQVDKTNQLTYLDICIKEGRAGGGGGGQGPQ